MEKDYKDTLNLPKTEFPMKANLVQKELELLDFWKTHNTYQKMQEKDKSNAYILHDGPPYANGHIHIGHALNKILKDIIVKYKSMKGFYSPYVPGWDCHGLPIEHEVDKKLGSKKGEVSILAKRTLCKEYALKFLDIQREEFKRLGVFGDWQEPYLTMSFQYEASIVREFGKFVEKGYIYKGKKPVHWCPSCLTALAEAEVEYADKESPSIYVKFRILDDDLSRIGLNGKNAFFIIWTTTPWTLPANLALAVNPEIEYWAIEVGDSVYIISRNLAKNMPILFWADLIDTSNIPLSDEHNLLSIKGDKLIGISAQHPFIDRLSKVVAGDFVSVEEGTGIVHIAPGHGEEDYEMGLKYGLDIYAPVDEKGCFTEDVKDFAGQNVFKANQEIIEKLKNINALIGSAEKITHSYPHCWRCKKPVIFRATEQWFISMEKNNLRQNALDEIKKTRWIPTWGLDRIKGMVENRPDWCISRQRTWGVPITLFQCKKCKQIITDKAVIDNVVKEVEKAGADVWFEQSVKDLLPEGYKCSKCNSSEFSKETDILDVWSDSGVNHAAVLEADKRLSWPADLYLEGSDQHRGWFQSSLLASAGTRGKAPYRAVLTHGFVVDGQGKKMSKSIGNVISPQEVTNKHGSEILRLWCASADYREDMRISKEILDRLVEAYRKIRNTCRFLLGNTYGFEVKGHETSASSVEPLKVKEDLLEIDRLALSMLQHLIEKVSKAYENFEFHEAFHSIYNFCVTNMSAFYLDVLKDRLYTFKAGSKERQAAQWVLYNILLALTKMMAPVLSFTAEEIWSFIPKNKEESIFLTSFPEVQPEFMDKEFEKKWENLSVIRDEVNKALEIKRQQKFIGNSLEAKVILYVDEANYKILEGYRTFLPTLFIVSAAEVVKDPSPPEDSYKSPLISGMTVLIEKAQGNKCSRCWNWAVTVGKYKDFPGLCARCYEVLTS
ncbi:MAG: isoleucine--tRNA ligase [Nitrospirae bacterium]|nr:isoleucine--tRNA ligase [Nitrospirota bacterium]